MLYDKKWEKVETQEEWRTVLLEAAVLVERGWCRGAYCMQRGDEAYPRFCAMGAVRHAAVTSGRDAGYEAVDRLEDYLGYRNNIVDWNDHHAKDGAEVAARMREAAKIA